MTNADLFKRTFGGMFATELWVKPEPEFLKWLNAEAELPINRPVTCCRDCQYVGMAFEPNCYPTMFCTLNNNKEVQPGDFCSDAKGRDDDLVI